MKKYLILALVFVLTMCLLAGCRDMTEDETTGPHDNSSVGDETAGSTPLPTATVPRPTGSTEPSGSTSPTGSSGTTDPTGSTGGSGNGSANGGSGGSAVGGGSNGPGTGGM